MRLMIALFVAAAALASVAFLHGPRGGAENPACDSVTGHGGGTYEGNPLGSIVAPLFSSHAADPETCDAAIAAAQLRWKLLFAAAGLALAGAFAIPGAINSRRDRRTGRVG